MKIGIIGSGIVAQVLGKRLSELNHDVTLGTRDPNKLDDKKKRAARCAIGSRASTARARSAPSRKPRSTASC